jgi:hypothetical protein
MKTKTCPPFLVACAILSAPATADAATFTLSGVTYGGGTLTGTFDFNSGVFSNFDITATGGSPNGAFFDKDNGSTLTQINATNSGNSLELLQLTLLASLPTSPDFVNPAPGTSRVTLCNGCLLGEFPVTGSVVAGGATGATPLPGALSLFAGGLAALGLFGRHRKRKVQAAS